MKKLSIFILAIVLCLPAYLSARSTTGFDTLTDYRPVGELRLWTFVKDDSTIGTLISTIVAEDKINEIDAIIINQRLSLDYNKIGTPYKMSITNDHLVSLAGHYLGDRMNLVINDQNERMEMTREGTNLSGFYTRDGNKIDQERKLASDIFAVESNFLDLYELYWASKDLTSGMTVSDTLYMFQTMTVTPLEATVTDFVRIRLYNEVFDSVFVINYTQPDEMIHYVTADKRLVKAIIPNQNTKAYLDLVKAPPQKSSSTNQTKQFSINKSPMKISISILIYFFIGMLTFIFLAKKIYNQANIYLALVVGAFSYLIIIFTQNPIVTYLVENIFVPKVISGGESPFIWGALPALAVGILQEPLKLLALYGLATWGGFNKKYYLALGALLGIGFAVAEAGYLANGVDSSLLFGLLLIERASIIIFHVISAAIYGHMLLKSIKSVLSALLIAILINFSLHYLPVFLQTRIATQDLMTVLFALISIFYLLGAMIYFKKND